MTREELRTYRYTEQAIKDLRQERERLYALAGRCVPVAGNPPSSGLKNSYPYPAIADNLTAVDAEITKQVGALLSLRARVESAFAQLTEREIRIMRAYYVECKSWMQVAMRMGCSTDTVWWIQRRSLKKIKNI